MAKARSFGNVELPMDEATASVLISLRLPLLLVRDLKRLALTEEHGGKYQVLIRDVLIDWAEQHHKPKRKRA